ncbi:E3 ubiquitin-protein ligase RNF130 isoform X2 [Bufo gargarizans]|uniref:E3 ubiquitin-protein ligase RNF130 isoform X2 n=1 Tax=Bufo gargarizans TaxID=30331 RepID=UPI001CF3C262|nr:E3 ubiquitin-protein ligase RNF130 isoform X2 [Bufo gargarizans]
MIPRRSIRYLNCLPLLVLLPCSVVRGASETTNVEYYNAVVNVTAQEPGSKPVLDAGRYGLDSPVTEAKGIIVTPVNTQGAPDRQGCDSHIRFPVPPNTKHWVALLQRGNCTFKEKILRAASHNATAVVIYNNNSNEDTVTMTHQGTGDIVAIMISESTGREILSYVERNISVLMAIAVGSRSPAKNLSRGSLVFVSISFIVLMIISSAWLIFYFIQRIRYTSARDRNQRILKKGYDRDRKQAEKRAIVVGVVKALQKKFGRTHDEMQIVKKWSDLKRRHPDWVKELGLPAPKVRRRLTTADLDVVEVSTEEDEQAGPSHSPRGATNPPDVGIVVEVSDEPGPSQGPKTSGPAPAEEDTTTPAPEEEDQALVTTPHQEVIKKMSDKIALMQKRHGKIRQLRALIQKSQRMLQEFECQYGEDLKELTSLQEELQKFP